MKLKLSVQYKDNYGLDRRPLSLSLIKAEGFDTRRFKQEQRVNYSLFRFYYQKNDIENKRASSLPLSKRPKLKKNPTKTLDATPLPKNENWCHRFVWWFFLGGGEGGVGWKIINDDDCIYTHNTMRLYSVSLTNPSGVLSRHDVGCFFYVGGNTVIELLSSSKLFILSVIILTCRYKLNTSFL